jgi:hypothetical protein
LLGSGEQWKASEFEILRDHGRFWRLYRRSENDLSMHVSVASVPVDADPMKTESWTWSEEVSRNDDYGLWGCLLSPGSEGGPMLLGRRNWRTVEFVAELTNDGRAVKTRKGGELPDLGGRSIRSLERGPATGETFVPSLTNSRGFYGRPSEVRLESSSDLTHWTDRSILLRDDRKDAVEFSSCTRTYAGEDLLMILCARIPGMPATDAEEQLWWEVLFLRVPKFRERKPETPPLWDGSR